MKPIPGWPGYEIDDNGVVHSESTGKALYVGLNCLNNRPDNLSYGTREQNRNDTLRAGNCARAKLTENEVRAIKFTLSIRNDMPCVHEIAQQYGVSRHTVRKIERGQTWGYVHV